MKNYSLNDTYQLPNGSEIPVLGFGTWLIEDPEEAIESVKYALESGYRHIDTAQAYENEEAVGEGIRRSGVPREEIYLTTKLANTVRGYQETLDAVNESLELLGVDYLDLILVHWPNPVRFRDNWQEMNAESWRALEDLYDEGKLKAIGISNFRPHHMEELKKTARVLPMVNQIKLSPGIKDDETVQYCTEHGILLEAYSPLGHGAILEDPVLTEIAETHRKTPAQVALRWSLQKGYIPLPKSVTPERIKENMDLYDFSLSDDEMSQLDELYFEDEQATDPDQAKH